MIPFVAYFILKWKSKHKKQIKLFEIYKDWILVVDDTNKDDVKVRLAFVNKVIDNETVEVTIASLQKDKTYIVKWIPKKNNFFLIK